MVRKLRAPAMSKEAMRQESERLVREAMARNVIITQGKTPLRHKEAYAIKGVHLDGSLHRLDNRKSDSRALGRWCVLLLVSIARWDWRFGGAVDRI